MALGPIEVLVIAFPGNQFSGEIIPELERLTAAGTITIVDGIFVARDDAGELLFMEFEQLDAGHDAARLTGVLNQIESLISDEDVAELAADLEPGNSQAILVFEHTWAKPLRDAIINSGGVLTDELRLPGLAVDQLLNELASMD
jgi:uncharacterized membrane protein